MNAYPPQNRQYGLKNANIPAIKSILFFFISGSFNPFANDIEKASIARPIPSKILSKKI